ncbi:unnamed protein product [Urochloa humidicola]
MRTMAAKTILLLAPVTLCFLVILGALATEATSVAVIFPGVVQCSNNSSTVVSNATLQVVINGTTVITTSQTTSQGRFLITVNVTSDEQLISLVNNSSINVVSTNACGASANPVVMLDDVPIALAGYRFLGEISKAKLLDFIRTIIGQYLISSGPNGGAADRGQQNVIAAADLTGAFVGGNASIVVDMMPRGRGGFAFDRVMVFVFVL